MKVALVSQVHSKGPFCFLFESDFEARNKLVFSTFENFPKQLFYAKQLFDIYLPQY